MNIFHAFLRGVVEEHSTGRSSLPKGWIMEVDVKKWMEVDVKRTASLASCTTKVFTNYLCIFSILFSSQKCNLQSAQTSGECTTVLQPGAPLKRHVCAKTEIDLCKYALLLRETAGCIMHEQRLHCQYVQRSIINVLFGRKTILLFVTMHTFSVCVTVDITFSRCCIYLFINMNVPIKYFFVM